MNVLPDHATIYSDYRFKRESGGMANFGYYTIGALARRTSVKVETIRYYERVGLLSPTTRSVGGHRLYEEDGISRMRFIRRCRELGFTVDDIREMLRMVDGKEMTCADIEALARHRLGDIRERISDLRRMERSLRNTLSKCKDGTSTHCPIIDSLYPTS